MATRATKIDLATELKRSGPRPVYAIDGGERVLVDEAVRAIRDAAVPPRARDFNYQAMVGKEANEQRIIEAAQMLPAFAQQRMVLITQCDKLELGDPFLAYLERPNPTTVLVLVAEKFDARTKLYKAFQKAGAALRFDPPSAREMPDAIKTRARAQGLKIDDGAIRSLADAVGTDLTQASQALEVLGLYVDGRAITSKDVAAVVSVTKEESVFELMDAIGGQKLAPVLEGIVNLLEVQREAPLRLLALIARQYRHLLKARAALDAGMSPHDLPGLLGVPPFVVDRIVEQARRQTQETFARDLAAIAWADRELKGGALKDQRTLERLVLTLATR